MTVVAGLALAVHALVEVLLVWSVSMALLSSFLIVVVGAFYTLFVAAPGERAGFALARPLRRLPLWARAAWGVFLAAPFVSLLFWPSSGSRTSSEVIPLPSLVTAYFGVSLALLSWERLRGLGAEQLPAQPVVLPGSSGAGSPVSGQRGRPR
ncbi:hypothetical protein Cme02nite_00800 [Catellatospora methionotrophica]|uniref:Uncharacterized protein n=1 Tax=Catellatospora methionotrophica TaxID=121620 RepID=A0A8J3PCV5_9ACTN|nr:hypothetical protein [Catellatospora methionotrophica]GIG11748.1 hypothetical protein Cme02nite_00800 [Catellatospora methionotrophica]